MRGRVRFRKRESTREAKTADTHIPPSRVKTEKKHYANLPYKQSHSRIYLRQRRRNERSLSSSSLSSSPVTTQSNATPFWPKNLFFQNFGWHGPMSTLGANRLCILSISNLHCDAKSSFVSPRRGEAGSQCLILVSVYLFDIRQLLLDGAFNNHNVFRLSILAFFLVYGVFLPSKIMTFIISCSFKLLALL